MDSSQRTPRRRVVNFTADEKVLLAKLVRKRPIVQSKLTDGKSVLKKRSAWEAIAVEFNSHAYVHKRDTLILKRAWDNMKSMTRKSRATKQSNISRTGAGPFAPLQSFQKEAIIAMVEEDIKLSESSRVPPVQHAQNSEDYVKQEAILRIKHMEATNILEMQILKAKLEIQEKKKQAAEWEEEMSRIYLEKAKLELEDLKKRLQ